MAGGAFRMSSSQPEGPAAAQGPLQALRAQMGLTPAEGASPVSAAAAAAALVLAPGSSTQLDGLALLGQQLLTGSNSGRSSSGGAGEGPGGLEGADGLGAEVLISAARQRLMTAEPGLLRMEHVELLAADYVSIAGAALEEKLLGRCAWARGGEAAGLVHDDPRRRLGGSVQSVGGHLRPFRDGWLLMKSSTQPTIARAGPVMRNGSLDQPVKLQVSLHHLLLSAHAQLLSQVGSSSSPAVIDDHHRFVVILCLSFTAIDSSALRRTFRMNNTNPMLNPLSMLLNPISPPAAIPS